MKRRVIHEWIKIRLERHGCPFGACCFDCWLQYHKCNDIFTLNLLIVLSMLKTRPFLNGYINIIRYKE